ncbi:MAG TPA: SusC/RagA family TonB-linked outer membrane protein [Pedobacter sp.]|uniref:SusC/RagA family TonB-linked outer membrane protein n=1 Tax=Pedobacter sp. TaxID=1411316 RepID=UPI002C7EEA61|nr:SusC/RagA family TonB-linked outer membrane protein [Pedobacter sp.]HMI02171.1 SusC/RagA family TonB-linked outer membrane protein [Pedobacter sp.]
MRLITAFVVSALLLLNVCASAQKLNYIKKKVTLARLFRELQKQTGYQIVWSEDMIDSDQLVDADFKNADPREVIKEVFDGLSIEYLINDKTKSISLAQKKLTAAENTGGQLLVTNELREVEIVSTGYQQIPKERATGSFAVVDKKQLDRRVGSEVFSRLEGIASGLLFNKNTVNNYPGNFDFSIRGRSTIYANDQPLIVLDNFPFNGDFNSINPNDVAGITVLKDAAAASIWGVRAGNGVIVIDTKRGKFNRPLNIAFNTNLSVSAKPDLFYNPNYISSSDFIDLETFLFDHGKYDAALSDVSRYPVVSPVVQILDRQRKGQSAAETAQQLNVLRGNDIRNDELKYFYRNQVAQQYALSLSGGSAWSSHFFSAGYDQRLSSLVANDNNRFTLNSQNTFMPAKNLEIEAGVYYIRSLSRVDSTMGEASATQFQPYKQFKNIDGQAAIFDRTFSAAYKQAVLDKGFLDWSYRPLDELGKSPFKITNNDVRINSGLKYTFIEGLSAAVKYQYQELDQKTVKYNGIDNYQTRNLINQYAVLTAGGVSGYNIPIGGILYTADGRGVSNNLRFQLGYQKDWAQNSISAIAGYEISSFESDLDKLFKYGYDRPGGTPSAVDTTTVFNLNPTGTGSIVESSEKLGKVDRIRSSFANAAYTYDGRYTVSGSARIDGSNYFGLKTNQKYVPLWSAGGLWNVNKENFYRLDWLPVLKLRASYGYNGNLDKSTTGVTTFRYSGLDTYTGLPYANILGIGNPELRWEKIGIANFGVDFELRDQVFTGRLEYYFKKGSDILGDKAFPSNTGISTLRGNYAKMKARGIDVVLTAQNFRGKLGWKTSLLFSAVRDWVSSYDMIEPGGIYYVGLTSSKPVLNRPVYGIYSYQSTGLDPLNGDPRGYLKGEISRDYHEIINSATIANIQYHGSARPTMFGGLSNTFAFCRFSLGINISYKFGYYFRKPSVNYYGMYNLSIEKSMNVDFAERWQKTGDEKFTNVPSLGVYSDDNFRDAFYNNSSATVARGDHIRLQDISLAFDLDRSNWPGIPVKQIQLYFYANNLGIIWKANDFGLDPDLVPSMSNRFVVPEPRSVAFGLKANF